MCASERKKPFNRKEILLKIQGSVILYEGLNCIPQHRSLYSWFNLESG
jgi:hypothetical protein